MSLQTSGLIFQPKWLSQTEYNEILNYLLSIEPIWEKRNEDRWLLRPVYWLGVWQFACLDYYHPPKGIYDRCVWSDSYPPILQDKVKQIERMVKSQFPARDIPFGWTLNTCLVNYYGDKIENGVRQDCARVGEHKDFEPGPVASLSFGERALFQFVESQSKFQTSQVKHQMWLDDNSLQIFGGDRFKKKLFHRVQRVDKKNNFSFPLKGIHNFETRRINLTFRYVPNDHIKRYHKLPKEAIEATLPYVKQLAIHSKIFEAEIMKLKSQDPSLA